MLKTGLTRDTIDKFYTHPDIAMLCIEHIRNNINKLNESLIIEPSAGNGSFIAGIKTLSPNYLFYDLQPESSEIIQQDYLLLDTAALKTHHDKIHVIGNPPFGRQSSLAIKFIKKSCEYCNTISFILPKSFKKDSLKKTFPLNFHLIFEIDLPCDSFIVDNVKHDVPCVFQIWEKKEEPRALIVNYTPFEFEFVNKSDNPDISVRRVGVNAGVIDTHITDKSPQSHYFIRFINPHDINETITQLKKITYEFNNTVGPKSISKQEMIIKFNQVLMLK